MLHVVQESGKIRKTAQAGFTLMEILIAVVIVGLVMAAATIGYTKVVEGQRNSITRQTLKTVKSAIDMFQMALNRYPEKIEDLVRRPEPSEYYEQDSLRSWLEGGYLEKTKVPVDSWSQKLQYELTQGEGAAHPYELWSYGSSEGKRAPKEKRISIWDL